MEDEMGDRQEEKGNGQDGAEIGEVAHSFHAAKTRERKHDRLTKQEGPKGG